jgi:putative transposase
MMMGMRVRLRPTVEQERMMVRHAGAARWTYNWGLEVSRQAWDHAGIRLRAVDLHKILVGIKRLPEYSWLYELSSRVPQEALRDLDRAYDNWWRRLKQGKRKYGAPNFKSRKRSNSGFRVVQHIYVERKGGATFIRLPRIGSVALYENDRLPIGPLVQATVKEHAGRWYVCVNVPVRVRVELGQRSRQRKPEGIDLGLTALATFSDGTKAESPEFLRQSLRKMRRLQRERDRRLLGSANRTKTNAQIARLYERTTNQRKDFLHKLTTTLATTHLAIVVEDLNVEGMSKNHALALGIQDAGWGEFRRQLEYKCDWYGCGLEAVPRFFPSTQTCSECGVVKTGADKLTLKQRTFHCDACRFTLDRDTNAARVLAGVYGSEITNTLVAASWAETQNACGAGSAGLDAVGGLGETVRNEAGTRLSLDNGSRVRLCLA